MDQSLASFSLVAGSESRPMLLVAGASNSGRLEIFARLEQRVNEPLIKAEFCVNLQVGR